MDRTDTLLPPRYRGPQRIGRGGMGEIFRATDTTLGRAVAIKLLAERYSEDVAVRERFTREALAAARLSGQPSIVTIFDVGEHNERPFIVMEYLAGGSLDARLHEDGAQRPQQALHWLEQAALALDAAHAEGVVHRDVKPANLLLDREGNVHVADFGIASAAGLDSLTMTGTVLGTAGYLSPEQAQGERATPASDRYSLAVLAFELLTGTRPYEGDSATAEASAHVHAAVPSVSERCEHLPAELDPVFRRALAKNPADRYPSCAEFVAALRDALADAAGQTGVLPAITAPTTPLTRAMPPREQEGMPPAPYYPRRPPRRSLGIWALLVGLIVLGALGGALAAVFLAGGHGHSARTVVLTRATTIQGQPTTVHVTTTAPAPTSASTPTSAPGRTAAQTTGAASSPPSLSGSGHTLNDQGYSLMQSGQYQRALPLLQTAVQKLQGAGPADPYEGYANYNLGYTLLHLNRCPEALTYLHRADALEPGNGAVHSAISQAQRC